MPTRIPKPIGSGMQATPSPRRWQPIPTPDRKSSRLSFASYMPCADHGLDTQQISKSIHPFNEGKYYEEKRMLSIRPDVLMDSVEYKSDVENVSYKGDLFIRPKERDEIDHEAPTTPTSPTTPRLKRRHHFRPEDLEHTPRGSSKVPNSIVPNRHNWVTGQGRRSGIPVPSKRSGIVFDTSKDLFSDQRYTSESFLIPGAAEIDTGFGESTTDNWSQNIRPHSSSDFEIFVDDDQPQQTNNSANRPFSFLPFSEVEARLEQNRPCGEVLQMTKQLPSIDKILSPQIGEHFPEIPNSVEQSDNHCYHSYGVKQPSISNISHPMIELARVVTIKKARISPDPPVKRTLPIVQEPEVEEVPYEYSPRKERELLSKHGRGGHLPALSSQRLSSVFSRIRSLSVKESKSSMNKKLSTIGPKHSGRYAKSKSVTFLPLSDVKPDLNSHTCARSSVDANNKVTGENVRRKVREQVLHVAASLGEGNSNRTALMQALKLYEAVFTHYADAVQVFERTQKAHKEALKNWESSHQYLFKVHQMVMKKLTEVEIMHVRK